MMAWFMLAAAVAAAPQVNSDCAGSLCGYGVLRPYFEKLADAKDRSGKPVHILQIGDSHTAGDAITGAWRDLLQTRHGSGGRGVMPPGKPFTGYNPRGVSIDMSAGWKISSIFGAGSQEPRAPVGLAGFSLTSTVSGARIGMTASATQTFNRFVICAIAEPGAGTLAISIGAETERLELGSPITRPECKEMSFDAAQAAVSVVVEGGPATITSWASFRDSGGVSLSNVGVVGSQLVHLNRADDNVVAEELRRYRPDLIVLAFGTNEGFAPRVNGQEYEIVLRSQISRIRRLAGNVPILLLGAPDALTRRNELLDNAATMTPAPCPEPAGLLSEPAPAPSSAAVPAAPTLPANPSADDIAAFLEQLDRRTLSLGGAIVNAPPPAASPAGSSGTKGQAGWTVPSRPLFPPPGLKLVRDVQRRVAQQLRLGFWDWEARMGGRCTAVSWVKLQPAKMRNDYVHYNSAGGQDIAGRLQADLDAAAGSAGGWRW
jgi:lysophospholipase L1-like esterase